MARYKSDFVHQLTERGFLHQATDLEALDQLASKATITGYIGFDATATSLHVGNLVGIMLLRLLQETGHRPIALAGGGTSKVGDPSGKDETRQLMTDTMRSHNLEGIKRSLGGFLDVDQGANLDQGARLDGAKALLLNNADWLDALSYIAFLRDYGRHFTINRMLTFDTVRTRLDREQPLTFLEFNYMIMQAYDFLELGRRYDCRLQMGGSDQWGNIVNGIELGRRVEGREFMGLTTPLITTASGAKMGKTAAGAVWLNRDRLADFDYWQFWRNTADADVGRFLKLFTEKPLDEIAKLEKLRGAEINEAKKILAFEATKLCRGIDAAAKAERAAAATFDRGLDVSSDLPVHAIASAMSILDVLHQSGLVSSKSEGRRLIRGGGAKLNDEPIDDETRMIDPGDLPAKLSAGKKRHLRLQGRLEAGSTAPSASSGASAIKAS